MDARIDLQLSVEAEVLTVTAVNRGDMGLKLWARDNSWGWSMFFLLLAKPDSDQWRKLTAKPVRWTRNLPRALDLPAGGQLEYKLRHADPDWEDLDEANAWLGQPLQVRVELRISETPEGVAQGVFIGEALTSPHLWMPPHRWLTHTGK